MKTYNIWVPVLSWLQFEVQAESKEQALQLHYEDKSEYIDVIDDGVLTPIDKIETYVEEANY